MCSRRHHLGQKGEASCWLPSVDLIAVCCFHSYIAEFKVINSLRCWLCRQAPFLVAFEERAQVFHTMVAAEKARGAQWMDRGSFATIRRDSLVDDGFHSLGQLVHLLPAQKPSNTHHLTTPPHDHHQTFTMQTHLCTEMQRI